MIATTTSLDRHLDATLTIFTYLDRCLDRHFVVFRPPFRPPLCRIYKEKPYEYKGACKVSRKLSLVGLV